VDRTAAAERMARTACQSNLVSNVRVVEKPLTGRNTLLTYHSVCMAASRTKSETDTKRRLLDAAMNLMICKGFKATTVDEICAEAGLTKGSFFHYFDSKEDLAKATARHFHAFQQRLFDGADFRSVADPLDRMFGRLDFIADIARNPKIPKSCLVGNLVQEIAGTHDDIRCVCESVFNSSVADFERDVAAAKLKHAPNADFEPAGVARLYLTLIQGSMILVKASTNTAIFEDNVDHLRRYIESLFGMQRSRNK
jgi:TetR/AcrR family transcriptional repressor of nem operon